MERPIDHCLLPPEQEEYLAS